MYLYVKCSENCGKVMLCLNFCSTQKKSHKKVELDFSVILFLWHGFRVSPSPPMSRTACLWAQPRTTVRQDRNRVHQLTTLTYSAGSGTHPGLGSCPRPAALGAGRGGAGLQGFIPETLNHSTIVDVIEGQKKHNFFNNTRNFNLQPSMACPASWASLFNGRWCPTPLRLDPKSACLFTLCHRRPEKCVL